MNHFHARIGTFLISRFCLVKESSSQEDDSEGGRDDSRGLSMIEVLGRWSYWFGEMQMEILGFLVDVNFGFKKCRRRGEY